MIMVGMGSNIGDREENLRRALRLLLATGHIKLQQVSPLYETQPVGFSDQPTFLNAVAILATNLAAERLLATCLAVEAAMGRVRTRYWGPRNIDIDVLIYHDLQYQSTVLTIPHPRLKERKFVLVPMLEVAGNFTMPDGVFVADALQGCCGEEAVDLYKPAGWERGASSHV
jgi:2-amino-4-hydroxy-6-hydroxymethyldihydropteridine diphosphokinase